MISAHTHTQHQKERSPQRRAERNSKAFFLSPPHNNYAAKIFTLSMRRSIYSFGLYLLAQIKAKAYTIISHIKILLNHRCKYILKFKKIS
jgi:hypothetical protein